MNQNESTTLYNVFNDYNVESWNGEFGYVNKAWCRLEMLYATNVQIYINHGYRANKFRHCLQRATYDALRPHFLYGTQEMEGGLQALVVPPLIHEWEKILDPKDGKLTNEEEDRPKIEGLVEALQPYMISRYIQNGYDSEQNEEGHRHGRGKMKYINGDVYNGEWKNNLRHGVGEYKMSDFDIYNGMWKNNLKHGQGTYTYASGTVFEGEWCNDMKHGQGILRNIDGSIYEGDFMADLKHGSGVWTDIYGHKTEGVWEKGKLRK